MAYSKDIAKAVKRFLEDDDWRFSFDDEKGLFNFNLTLKSKLQKVSYIVDIKDNRYFVYGISPMNADESCMAQMAEFICRANYGLANGNFELDFRDGEIRYKTFVNCKDMIPNQQIIKDSIYLPAVFMKRYADGIVAVLFGLKSPEEAVRECEEG